MTNTNTNTYNELIEDIHAWTTVEDYQTIMQKINTGTRRDGFASTAKQVPILHEDVTGLIALDTFFDPVYTEANMTHLSKEEFYERLQSDNWKETNHDNSYNYGGYLERDVDFKTFGNTDTGEVIVLYSVHVGLDIRAGYTNAFPVLYIDEYAFQEHAMTRYPIAEVHYTDLDNEERQIHVSAEAFSEYVDVYITDARSRGIDELDYAEDTFMDLTDLGDVQTYLEENDIPHDPKTIRLMPWA